jgi:hypothetical protein
MKASSGRSTGRFGPGLYCPGINPPPCRRPLVHGSAGAPTKPLLLPHALPGHEAGCPGWRGTRHRGAAAALTARFRSGPIHGSRKGSFRTFRFQILAKPFRTPQMGEAACGYIPISNPRPLPRPRPRARSRPTPIPVSKEMPSSRLRLASRDSSCGSRCNPSTILPNSARAALWPE